MKPNKREQKKVDAWNAKYEVGQDVLLRRDNGETVQTQTRSNAELLSGHTAVIWLQAVIGCYCLDRVTAVSIHEVGKGGAISPPMSMVLRGLKICTGTSWIEPSGKTPASEVFKEGALLAVPVR